MTGIVQSAGKVRNSRAIGSGGRGRRHGAVAARPMLSTAASADAKRVMATFLLAFSADPIARWVYRDPEQYRLLFPVHVRGLGGAAFPQGNARIVGEYAGAALWLPPGTAFDHATLEASLPAGREDEISRVFDGMASYHPTEPHWYLAVIGIDPVHQRKGYGPALMQDGLRRCDEDRVAAYVESTNPSNIPFYEQHGFKLLGTIEGDSAPPLFPMLRAAR